MAKDECRQDKRTIDQVNLFPDESRRCAFGRGWEWARGGGKVFDKPYPKNHWKFNMWSGGWLGYKASTDDDSEDCVPN